MTRKAAPKSHVVYIVVREMASVNRSYTEPDRVFASQKAAQDYADRLNRELRVLTNPFADEHEPGFLMSGEKGFSKLLKKLQVPEPKPLKGESYVRWERWWAETDMTDAQRDAIWDALDEFEWYKVKKTTLEG